MKPSPKVKPNNILRLRLFELHKAGKLTRKGKIALGRLNMAARLANRVPVTLSPPE